MISGPFAISHNLDVGSILFNFHTPLLELLTYYNTLLNDLSATQPTIHTLFITFKSFNFQVNMEEYSSYQNAKPTREAEFQRMAQNIGTNIQKMIQNGRSFFT